MLTLKAINPRLHNIICVVCLLLLVQGCDFNRAPQTQSDSDTEKHITISNPLKNCTGSTSLDIWAGLAGAGPEYPITSRANNIARDYFYGRFENRVGKSYQNLENLQDGDFRTFILSDDNLRKMYLEFVPEIYLKICERELVVSPDFEAYFALININEPPTSKRWSSSDFIAALLLNWEIKLHNHQIEGNVDGIEELINEIDEFILGDVKYQEVFNNPKKFPTYGVEDVNIIRVASFLAQARAGYAIRAESFFDMRVAQDSFNKIQKITSSADAKKYSFSGLPYYNYTHKNPHSFFRFTAAQNEFYFMQAIKDEIKYFPNWLLDPTEQLSDYAERISSTKNNYSKKLCPLPTDEEIKALIAQKATLLMCETPINIFKGSMKLKLREYFKAESVFNELIPYEYSPFLWAKNQYLKHEFLITLNNTRNIDKLLNSDLAKKKNFERECQASQAFLFAKSVIPNSKPVESLKNYCN